MQKLSKMMAVALALGLVAPVFAAAPAMAQEDMGAWDANDDGVLDNDEFATGFGESGVFGDWDSDGDGSLTEDEFNAGVFGGYDDNGDGTIDESEFGDVGDDMGDGGLFDV